MFENVDFMEYLDKNKPEIFFLEHIPNLFNDNFESIFKQNKKSYSDFICSSFRFAVHNSKEEHFLFSLNLIKKYNIEISINEMFAFSFITRSVFQYESNHNEYNIFLQEFFNPNRFFINNNCYAFYETLKEILDYINQGIYHENILFLQLFFKENNTVNYFFEYHKDVIEELKAFPELHLIQNKLKFDSF
jgi:hypothetical protein